MTRLLAAGFALAANLGAVSAQDAMVEEMTLGDPAAPVTVMEYASLRCLQCGALRETSMGRLRVDDIDTGKVYFVYREVFSDRDALWAGLVARCGWADRYFVIADVLYGKRDEWAVLRAPEETVNNLRRFAQPFGLSDGEFNACMSDRPMAEALVATFQRNAEADGINGELTFLVNGAKHGNLPYEDLTALIDAQL